jgi:hypothetical protein
MTFKESIKSCIVIMIIFGIIYTGYNYYLSPTATHSITEVQKTPFSAHKDVLTPKMIQKFKDDFNKTDENFSNRIIHTKDGITIERIR